MVIFCLRVSRCGALVTVNLPSFQKPFLYFTLSTKSGASPLEQKAMNAVNLPPQVLDWLFKVLQPYYDARTTFRDVVFTLSENAALRPKTRVFTDFQGRSQLLLCLYGRLEAVPVLLWVPLEYPIAAPYAFVDLESLCGARLRANSYVDANGAFSLPALERWDPQVSTVGELVSEMARAVAEEPPVYMDEELQSLPIPPRAALVPTAAPTAAVDDLACQVGAFTLKDSTSSRAPALPPKPPLGVAPESSNAPIVSLPPRPPIAAPGRSTETMPSSNSPRPPASVPAPPLEAPLPPRPPAKEPYSSSAYAGNPLDSQHAETLAARPATAPTTPQPMPSLMDTDASGESNPSHHRAIEELRHTIASLSEEDRQSVQETLKARMYAVQNATAQFKHISDHEAAALEQFSQTLCSRRQVLRENLDHVDEQLQKAQQYIQDYGPDTDLRTILAPEPAGVQQLRNLVAKDHAITDTIHALNHMLGQNVITLDIFIKKTRALASDQFLTRVHVNKILEQLAVAQ
ncbi:LAQU0S02e04456g1_1 [Lachancea quebecensis]|uniref:LAQU0S02e04456g1_1 n=1 Tax=Lachancea quebecensis TaxID=1654605 RepID=A0A0P1KNG2_9SACH|nr:LAQU0S02e04456g1_1 [Lachancea quebecensis]